MALSRHVEGATRVKLRCLLAGPWAAVCFWILWSGLTARAPVDVKDMHVGMSFWMTMLSFPSGLLVSIGTDIMTLPFGKYFNVAWRYHPQFYCFIWFCYFVVGIVQWFLIVPWIMRRVASTPNGATARGPESGA